MTIRFLNRLELPHFDARCSGGRAFFKRPRGMFSRIELAVGRPIPPGKLQLDALQAEVARLRGDWR